ncbi:MAG: carboxymuconolactone decarboxylase family protein [Planctomycetota bacterium]|jgi:alkylhydroperoxidase family enzyme
MFLKDVEQHEPTEASGRFGRIIKAFRKTGQPIPGIYHLFAWRPEAARHLNAFMEEVMRAPSPLSPGQRELIAAWTSARNHCLF